MSPVYRIQQGMALLSIAVMLLTVVPGFPPSGHLGTSVHGTMPSAVADAPQNLSASLNRLVELVGASGAALLALVWARVALSWFSNDVTKKVQAKDRARDALIGTLLFTAALTGLVWGLAHWVLTGT